jgi:DNA-binding CsgD family transcriptional regulator
MVDQDGLSRLVARIYDAVLYPEQWDSALLALSDALGGAGLNIAYVDSTRNPRFFLGMARLDPERGKQFLHAPEYVEPTFAACMAKLGGSLPVGRLICREEIWTDKEYANSPIFNDVIRPQGMWHWAFPMLAFDAEYFVPFGILRAPGAALFDGADAKLIARVLPHLTRAVQTALRLGVLGAEAASLEALIDRLSIGVISVDAAGRVLRLNRVAEDILRENDGLTAAQGRVAAAKAADTAKLRRLIGEASRTSRGEGLTAGGAMELARPSAKRPLAIMVAPFRSEKGRHETHNASVVVFVSDPERKPRPPIQALASAFGLTRREAQLAERLAQGDTIERAAEALGMKRNTARVHLQGLFNKTGVRRRTEFEALLRAWPIESDLG